jgi:hypothetical protein
VIEIWAGGQTGVDLGAHLAALDGGLAIGGFMPADGYNEAGQIPDRVAMHLTRHNRTNPAARTGANVASTDAALVLEEDRRRAGVTRGTALTIRLCEERCRRNGRGHFALLVADYLYPADAVAGWVATWPRSVLAGWREADRTRPLKLLVAGPRASLWPEGEETARRVVGEIAKAVRQ